MSDNVEEFFEHFGIRGMHWGVVRDRGKNGRVEGPSKPVQSHASDDAKAASKAGEKIKSKGIESLSNTELSSYVARLNLEQQYSRLTPQQVSPGKKFASDVMNNASKQVATEVVKSGIKGGGKLLFNAIKSALTKSK